MADLAKQKALERAQLISAGDHFNPKKTMSASTTAAVISELGAAST